MVEQGYIGYTEEDMDLMKNSPEAGRLLATLHDKHQIYALAEDRNPQARGELAAIMSELLGLDLGVAENELITDVMQ